MRRYLKEDEGSTRRLLLAERLAHLFDQYVTYRPRMVLSWQAGDEPEELQAILWRELIEQHGASHFAARCQQFMEQTDDEKLRAALPSRLCLMGGPGLPPLFLQMLGRIGQLIPTHVFSFTVCKEYFADALPLPAVAPPGQKADPEDLLPEMGEGVHPLLVSLGNVGADYQHLLEMIGDYEEGPAEFRHSTNATVLGTLQNQLIDQSPGEANVPEVLAGIETDDSITVDSCHSRLREVETLHDRLLSWFAADPSMRPEDVVVLAPQIEEYSPLISAVFSARSRATSEKREPHIPFRIADRSEKHTNAAARALLLALSLLRGRFKASEVLDLLQLAPVRKRYEIESASLERLGRWISEAGIRWGVDAAHRKAFSLPEDDANTWRFGLRRLLLGFALPDDGEQLWQEVVPFDDVAARDLPLLGRLCDFCARLFVLRERLQSAGPEGLTLGEWSNFLSELAEALIADADDGEWDATSVRTALFDMNERRQAVALANASDLEVKDEEPVQRLGLAGISHLLEQELDASRPSTDFLAGGVTFCALLPLRTIPFRAVCVLGMNQGQFPRADAHHHLDLIAKNPRRGDRSLRADDRYLFLEVLLAARERLSLSYVGHSVQDNTEKPPSVVLTELSSVIDQMLGGRSVPYLTPRVHPLQPFHPSYFYEAGRASGPRRVSFDQSAYLGAVALSEEPSEVRPFYVADSQGGQRLIEEGPGEARWGKQVEVSLASLVTFWKDPSAAYLAARGVRLNDEIDQVEDREPVLESALARFIIGDRTLKELERGGTPRTDIALRRGDLPIGQGGPVLLHTVKQVAQDILASTASHREQAALEPVPVALEFEAKLSAHLSEFAEQKALAQAGELADWPERIVLSGVIDKLYGKVRLEMSYGQETVGRVISLWIHHLVACAATEQTQVEHSVLVTRGATWDNENSKELVLEAVEPQAARRLLAELSVLSLLGRLVPLRFFAGASFEYLTSLHKPLRGVSEEEKVPKAFERARSSLQPNVNYSRGTNAVTELFRGEDPLGAQGAHEDELAELPFARLAAHIFGPFLAARLEEAKS